MVKKIVSLFVTCLLLVASVSAAQQKVQIQGAVGKLAAVITTPEIPAGKKVPMVLLLHGFTGTKDEAMWINIASELEAKEYASIRFDFNGHGESEGAFEKMTVLNEIEDAKCVYACAEELPYVRSISVIGHSQGGVVASMFAGEMGAQKVAKLVLLAPAAVLREDAIRGNTMGATYDSLNPPEKVHIYGKYSIGRDYITTARTLRIYETAQNYTGPVCLIHGTGDVIAPYSYSERYASVYKNAELHLLPGFDHMFSQNLRQAVAIAVVFITK
jgi:pimeloyl-ACP methyl ester carboxylesterase